MKYVFEGSISNVDLDMFLSFSEISVSFLVKHVQILELSVFCEPRGT